MEQWPYQVTEFFTGVYIVQLVKNETGNVKGAGLSTSLDSGNKAHPSNGEIGTWDISKYGMMIIYFSNVTSAKISSLVNLVKMVDKEDIRNI